MKFFVRSVVVLGVVALSSFAVVTGIRIASRYDSDLAVARAAAVTAKVYADSIVLASAETAIRADSAKRAAEYERRLSDRLAKEAEAREKELRRREVAYALAAQEAPDTCAIILAQADSVIEQAGAGVLKWHAAFVASRNAYLGLSRAYDSLAAANVDLQRATAKLSSRTGELVRATSGSFLRRLLPQPHFGVTAGIDANGRPTAVFGIGAGWRF